MADMRISTFLPTVKCSMCARDIEISQMGDHVCGSSQPTPPPESSGDFNRMYIQPPPNNSSFLKPGRSIPPRVDTSAANRPFAPQDQLTPVSASPSRSNSPFPSNEGWRSPNPFSKPPRSATVPVPRAPPSPEVLSSNLDCAFPPFPSTKPTAQPKPPGGVIPEGDGRQNLELSSGYAPLSASNTGNGPLLQRMNTIVPGPFNPSTKNLPTAQVGESQKGHRRQATSGSLKDMTMSSSAVGQTIQRPATAGPGQTRTSTANSNGFQAGVTLPRMPRKNGYGGLGHPAVGELQPLTSESRSQTFPLRSPSNESPFRRPSEPVITTGQRRPSNEQTSRLLGTGLRAQSGSPPRHKEDLVGRSDVPRPMPPRAPSMRSGRTDSRSGESPSVPANVDLSAEFGIGNPYHTPSDSQSSDKSAYSEASMASSRSSPLRQSRRQGSDVSKMHGLMADLQSSMSGLGSKTLPFTSLPMSKFSRDAHASPRNGDMTLLSPESPTDPAIQEGRLSPVARPPNTSRSLSPMRDLEQRPAMRRAATNISRPTVSKGNCKGCGEIIRGKSVSSADGRLTGRYHKDCFNCTTCSEPFKTATFYVIADAPYCERHYHKLNGSVCSTCDKGIEGQYLESESKQKFHPQCLACSDCKRILKNDYFEMSGKVYCERDAFRRAQQNRGRGPFLGPGMGKGSNRMERRTTRLMMM